MAIRKIKNIQQKFSKYLDPFGIVAIFIIFSFTFMAIQNLAPTTRTLEGADVLGASNQQTFSMQLINGFHEVVNNESLKKTSENTFQYSASIKAFSSGQISKPILQITTPYSVKYKLKFSGTTESLGGSKVSLVINDTKYPLQDLGKNTYIPEETLKSGTKVNVFLLIENSSNVQFDQTFNLKIVTETNN